METTKKIVISAVNIFEGGTLSILKECVQAIENSDKFENFEFLILVHKKNLFNIELFKKVTFIDFPKSRRNYIYRLYYEYIYFKTYAKTNGIDFWFSLHDVSPNVGTIPQAVYCHNPTPFKRICFNDLIIQPKLFMFTLFYSYLYKLNLKKNKYVVVQQSWLKNEFFKRFGIDYKKIVIANPQKISDGLNYLDSSITDNSTKDTKFTFLYPTLPRPFKNIEIIGDAVGILNSIGINNFNVVITVDGNENKYSKAIHDKYGKIDNIMFIGLQTRQNIFRLYNQSNCLIFPSTLETWGLPISEFKYFDKPMLVANLEYAKETVGNYQKVKFFSHNDAQELAGYMKDLISFGEIHYDVTQTTDYPQPYVQDWEELIVLLIK